MEKSEIQAEEDISSDEWGSPSSLEDEKERL